MNDELIKNVAIYLKKVSDERVKELNEMNKFGLNEDEVNDMRKELFEEDSDWNSNIEHEFIKKVSKKVDELFEEEFDL